MNNKERVRKLLKGIETGDPAVVEVVNEAKYIQHNPGMSDGLPTQHAALTNPDSGRNYQKLHRLLAEGNFVLSVCEGTLAKAHSSFYDLLRLADGKIMEHWDTTEEVLPQSEWKNNNGKF